MTYPVARPGLARQGLEVYRANGCAYCHSQQVGQTGTVLEIALTDAGTNQAATVAALLSLAKASTEQPAGLDAAACLGSSADQMPAATNAAERPAQSHSSAAQLANAANAAVKTLNATSAKAQLWIVPVGPDLARGWGKRRTVAEDFLFDSPVMPGSQRVGPDLADVGTRLPDANWHLLHLYAPQLQVKGSIMPPYRFLFEQRKIEAPPVARRVGSPGDLAPPAGYEVVPTPAAKALAAYLISLHADAPLFVAPLTVAAAPAATTDECPAASEPRPPTPPRRAPAK